MQPFLYHDVPGFSRERVISYLCAYCIFKLLIIDEVSVVSSLNLAYIHLRLDEIFVRDEWLGGVNVLFVGDILQLPPVNGALVYESISNKSITTRLGCLTSVNIRHDTVVYDELTINQRQKNDQGFSSMLDEVLRGCPAQATLQALKERVFSVSVVDKFNCFHGTHILAECVYKHIAGQ